MRKPNQSLRNRLSLAGAAAIAAITLGACSAHGSSHPSASAEATKARTVATAADTRLQTDGYAATHLPGFGKFDLGLKSAGMRYEAVYTYTGKNAQLLGDMVTTAQKKLAGDQGVSVKYVSNLIIIQADNVNDLKKAVHAVLTSLR